MSSKLLTNITAIKSLKKFIDLEASKAKRAKSQLLPKANFTDNTSKFSFFVEGVYTDWVTRIVEINDDLCFIGLDLEKSVSVSVVSTSENLNTSNKELDNINLRAHELQKEIESSCVYSVYSDKHVLSAAVPVTKVKFLPLLVFSFANQGVYILCKGSYLWYPLSSLSTALSTDYYLQNRKLKDMLYFYTYGAGVTLKNGSTLVALFYNSTKFNVV